MIIVGILLLLFGYLLGVGILTLLGWIALGIGLLLLILGFVGDGVGGRRHWF